MVIRVFAAFILLNACQSSPETEIEQYVPASMKVRVVTVTAKPVAYEIYAEGEIMAAEPEILYFRKSGRLESLHVIPGQRVRAGDTLAILENQEEYFAMQLARIRKEEARYTFESEAIGFSETGNLTDTVRKSIRYSSGLAAAEIHYAASLRNWHSTFLVAGKGGIAADITLGDLEMVQPLQRLGYIYHPDELSIRADLLELHTSRIKKGTEATIVLLNGRRIESKVSAIDHQVDKDGFVSVYLVPSKSPGIPGSHVTVIFRENQHTGITVPATAILARDEKLMVYKADHGKVKWQYIRTGLQTGEDVEVLEGLEAGDTIVVERLAEISHGMEILPFF